MNNPERLATLGTQDEGKNQKQKQKTHNTICVGHHYLHKQTQIM